MSYFNILLISLLAISFETMSSPEKPLYEIGAAGFIGSLPDYPASDENKIRSLVLPTFLYRGEVLRNDDKGMRARFLRGDNWLVDLSFGGSLPADADQNKAREDMPSLDLLLEIGPRFNYIFFNENQKYLSFTFPLRVVASTSGTHTEEQGRRITPELYYSQNFQGNRHKIHTSLEVNYGSEKLADYFYEVDSHFETADRKPFDSKAGFIGSNISFGYSYRQDKLLAFIGVKFQDYSKSTNKNSYLHRSNHNTSIFFAFNYFFYQSKEKETQ